MIIGEAAPKDHHTDHEDGGDDEIDCTGLEGAGGISLPFDDLHFHTFFESLDFFGQNNYLTGAVVGSADEIYCEVDGPINSRGQIYKALNYKYVVLTFAKDREFRAQVKFVADTNSTQKLVIGTGDLFLDLGFGFKVQDGLLKAYSNSPGGTYEETIEDWGASGYNEERKLRAKLTAGSKVEFYVNNVLVKTDTNYYPTGSNCADTIFQATAQNPAEGNAAGIYLSEFQMTQKA